MSPGLTLWVGLYFSELGIVRKRNHCPDNLPALCFMALVVPLLQLLCLLVSQQLGIQLGKDQEPLASILVMFPIMGFAAPSNFVKRYFAHRYAFKR
jgi:hypothetical protein